MPKYPFMARRKGSKNFYYKRPVPKALQAEGRPKQIWRSLNTDNEAAAKVAYRAVDAETDALLAEWRQDDSLPLGAGQPQSPVKSVPNYAPLTPALLRRLADAHYLNVYENDFQWRGDLWKKVHEGEDAFWCGDIVKLPEDDWVEFRGKPYSYFTHLMEEPILEDVFLYSIFRARKAKLQQLQKRYQLGDSTELAPVAAALLCSKEIELGDADRSRLMRKLMEVEIKALEDLTAGNEASFDGIVERQATVEYPPISAAAATPGELMSQLVEKYLEDTGREREWPSKTVLRKRGELRELLEVAGDKPVNEYRQADGVKFKDVQLALPVYRQKPPFKGLTLAEAAEKSSELRAEGEKFELLNPITINDKIGTASLFFEWAKSRDSTVVNPVANLRIQRAKNKRKGKKRHPWSIDELNGMFAAPIYTGCRSEYYWKQPGNLVLRQTAKYWVPLIALFSGMRLGEIIQLQVADVKRLDGIEYFDVTPVAIDPTDVEADGSEEEKSLKTVSSRRGIPIHQRLFELGFGDFLDFRRGSGEKRLFPEFEKAKDDGSWSKQFSKHFQRFRESIGVAAGET